MKKNKLNFKINDNGCFIVTSHQPNKDGYCYLRLNRRQMRVHRHVYQECFGEIEKGLIVRHKCDTRTCINPEHLELGTDKDNAQDCVSRGRKAIGERCGQNKITEEKAREIKIMIRDGKRNCDIIRALNVSVKTVVGIREYKTWKHVNISA